MIVEFSVYPMSTQHTSDEIAEIIKLLNEHGLKYKMGAMSTSIEGRWDEVMPVIKECHELMLAKHGRTITNLTIDERSHEEHTLDERISSVQRKLEPGVEVSSH